MVSDEEVSQQEKRIRKYKREIRKIPKSDRGRVLSVPLEADYWAEQFKVSVAAIHYLRRTRNKNVE